MISISNRTKPLKGKCCGRTQEEVPDVPFKEIAEYTLPQGYELSLVFVDGDTIRELNRTYRQIDKATNVLSFPLSEKEGEIFINPTTVREEARALGEEESSYLAYIFIHALLHLKGFDHGSKMEKEEERIKDNFYK